MRQISALIICADPVTTATFVEVVEDLGLNAIHAEGAGEALQHFEQLAPAVAILDLAPSEVPKLQFLRHLTRCIQVPVIALAEDGSLRVVVDAMRAGAIDVLYKNAAAHDIKQAMRAALMGISVHSYREIFRHSPRMQALEAVVVQLAAVSTPILVRGESGVGKEVIARTIHNLSDRSERPFRKIGWAAVPADRALSELEGIASAADGTLFLDEINEASAAAQTRLLSILVGDDPKPRLIAATSVDMTRLVTRGVFHRDLYERLAVATIDVPALRERREEIDTLTHRFLERVAREFQCPIPPVSESMAELLRSYDWPGNVRELEGIVRRWIVLGGEGWIRTEIEARRAAVRRRHAAHNGASPGLREISRLAATEAERVVLREALLRGRGNRAAAARELKISYRTLLQKVNNFGLAPPRKP
jgi:two-component system, NtrC family, response regulator AtoC